MVREKQLSLCFEPQAGEAGQPFPDVVSTSSLPEQQPATNIFCLRQFKYQRAFVADANSARLLEKIAHKVKYF